MGKDKLIDWDKKMMFQQMSLVCEGKIRIYNNDATFLALGQCGCLIWSKTEERLESPCKGQSGQVNFYQSLPVNGEGNTCINSWPME